MISRRISFLFPLAIALLLASSGCAGPEVPAAVSQAPRPFAGVSLRVACSDPSFTAAAKPLVQAWAGRTGARVELVNASITDATDVGLIGPAEIGTWAEKRELLSVPASLLGNVRFRWNDFLGPYRDRLARWGNAVVAVPLGGGGQLLVYRSDRLSDTRFIEKFRERFQRPPAAPATWDDVADLAEAFRLLDGRPSLPPWPGDSAALVNRFFQVAASYDRKAKPDPTSIMQAADLAKALSFQFQIETGQPRLQSPGFEAALAWMARVNASTAAGSADPVAAIVEGRASLAILTLEELARLPRDNATRFGILRLPGVQTETGVNDVPYFAWGTFGVVRSRCSHPDAAFDLLRELGSPERSAELIARAHSGIGPVRNEQLDRSAWLPYGFDAKQTSELATALRGSLGLESTSPTFVLRGPDHGALTDALAKPLREAIAGKIKPADALQQAESAWKMLDASHEKEAARWRRKAMGLE